MKFRVEVTAEQIQDAGTDRRAWAEPVEAALRALTGEQVDIDGGGHAEKAWSIATIGQDAWTLVLDLPDEAHAWLAARWPRDGRRRALAEAGEPFAFEVEVPTWVADLVRLAT